MSEATPPTDPTPEPWTPPDPPAAWTPPDPLAAPQPWAPPTPWSASTPPPPDPTAPERPAPAGPDRGVEAGTGPTAPGGEPAGSPAPGGEPAGSYFPTHRPATPPSADQPGPTGPGGPPPVPAPSGWPPPAYPPPYAYPGAPRPASGNGRTVAIVLGVVAALVLSVCGCLGGLTVLGMATGDSGNSADPYDDSWPEPEGTGPDDFSEEPTEAPASPAVTPSAGSGRFTVVYEVTGTGPVDVQFYDANADFLQLDEVSSPWRLTFTANDRERVQIIASPGDSGEVTCRITINGKVVSRDSGEYGATCFGW
ncbi:MmpS family transport accessory protein [Micromonospora auratinigra]|uniref:Membrane protein n=1 Tax=Micromonospora auratinigra TaxID=261654 RepID=A0A1A8ZUQ0_9ACTN|nr:MmpS family transport accessory protein [Micromonospora auratinigra]SBT47643.1 membrane protein [Micromonospora auratinigra]